MSRNNEIIARMFQAFNRGGVEALAEFLDPEVVFSEPPEQPGATTFYGRERVLEGFGRWSENWAAQQSVIERVIERGDTVVVLTREKLVGRDGIAVEQASGIVFTFRNQKVLRFDAYWDQSKALEAASVPEQKVHPDP
jgi:ketosteroid isomerase-like protein